MKLQVTQGQVPKPGEGPRSQSTRLPKRKDQTTTACPVECASSRSQRLWVGVTDVRRLHGLIYQYLEVCAGGCPPSPLPGPSRLQFFEISLCAVSKGASWGVEGILPAHSLLNGFDCGSGRLRVKGWRPQSYLQGLRPHIPGSRNEPPCAPEPPTRNSSPIGAPEQGRRPRRAHTTSRRSGRGSASGLGVGFAKNGRSWKPGSA